MVQQTQPGPPPRRRPPLRMVQVSRVERLTPRVLRVPFAGEELAGFEPHGPAEHIKVFFPPPGQDRPVRPTYDADGGPVYPPGVERPVRGKGRRLPGGQRRGGAPAAGERRRGQRHLAARRGRPARRAPRKDDSRPKAPGRPWSRLRRLRGRRHARHPSPPAPRPRPRRRSHPHARLLEAGRRQPPGPRPRPGDVTSGSASRGIDRCLGWVLERGTRFELATACLEGRSSTTELPPLSRFDYTAPGAVKLTAARFGRIVGAGLSARGA